MKVYRRYAVVLVLILMLTTALPVVAQNLDFNEEQSQQIDLSTIVSEAVKEHKLTLSVRNNRKTIYSKDYILEFTLDTGLENGIYPFSANSQTATSSCQVKNSFGNVLGTLTATASFSFDGLTAQATSASGFSNVPFYNVSTSKMLGPEQAVAWAKITFAGTCTRTPATFNLLCTITCDGKGGASASWR